jgi:hypothetical protein
MRECNGLPDMLCCVCVWALRCVAVGVVSGGLISLSLMLFQ